MYPRPLFVMIHSGEFEHEDGSAAVDTPADSNVGAAVEFSHDTFKDPGGEFGSSLVSEEEPTGVGVADEGEDLGFCGSEVPGSTGYPAGFELLDEGVVRRLGLRKISVTVRVGEEIAQKCS